MPARLTNNKLYKIFSIFDDATFTSEKFGIRLFLIRSKNRSRKRKSSRRGPPLLPKYSLYPFILSEKKKKKKKTRRSKFWTREKILPQNGIAQNYINIDYITVADCAGRARGTLLRERERRRDTRKEPKREGGSEGGRGERETRSISSVGRFSGVEGWHHGH